MSDSGTGVDAIRLGVDGAHLRSRSIGEFVVPAPVSSVCPSVHHSTALIRGTPRRTTMSKSRRTLSGTLFAAVATVAVLTGLSAGPAQGAPSAPGREGKSPTAPVAPRDDSRAPDRAADAPLSVPPDAASALATIQERIARYVDAEGTKHTFGSYVDPATGRIVIETDAPQSVVTTLTNLNGEPPGQDEAADEAQVRRTTTGDRFSRRDDSPAFYGGGGITSPGAGICSSGYAVQNGAGTRFMTTAGHCFADGATVTTESGRYVYGTVSHRRLPTVTGHPMDVELIGGQSYASRIFTGGIDSMSSLPVVGAGGAVVGFDDYCHSGRTTGEHCGHTATSTTAQVCTGTGCKSPVVAFTGGTLPQPGDSGAPFYVKDSTSVWIRGHVIAGNTGTAYAQGYPEVASALGVGIVTG
ncbi:hypothetical protein ACWD4G_28545 [Streptomyces sp. NPDC002643]